MRIIYALAMLSIALGRCGGIDVGHAIFRSATLPVSRCSEYAAKIYCRSAAKNRAALRDAKRRLPIYQVNHSLRFAQSREPNLGARDLLLNSLQTAEGAASMIPTAS